MAHSKAVAHEVSKCRLCGANAALLLLDGVLTAPVEVFDYTREVAPTLTRAVCGRCAEEVTAAHAELVAALLAPRTKGRRRVTRHAS
jgi:hypothetical protein